MIGRQTPVFRHLKVLDILLVGNHLAIKSWREKKRREINIDRKNDLFLKVIRIYNLYQKSFKVFIKEVRKKKFLFSILME